MHDYDPLSFAARDFFLFVFSVIILLLKPRVYQTIYERKILFAPKVVFWSFLPALCRKCVLFRAIFRVWSLPYVRFLFSFANSVWQNNSEGIMSNHYERENSNRQTSKMPNAVNCFLKKSGTCSRYRD